MCDSIKNSSQSIDDNSNTVTTEKKKRGRKPKIKTEDDSTPDVKEKKKRGRKPKSSTNVSVSKETKKRGRKPAGKIISLNEKNSKMPVQEDDCIITHIPIKLSDIEKNDNIASSTLEEEEIEDNTTINNDENEYFSEDYNSIFIKSNEITESANIFSDSVKDKSDREIIKTYEKQITELKNVIKTLKTNTGLKSRQVIQANVNFNYIDNEKKKWKECTDVYCWWCCHPYETCPVSLPEKIYNDTYYVFGSFCSFNCAASYNINLDDYKIWERLSLLKSLYLKIFKEEKEITPSPPRNTLEIFGGHLSIEAFRSNVVMFEKEYLYLIPPMVSMTPLIEEHSKSSYTFSNTHNNNKKFVPLYGSNNIKASEKLSRKKPISNAKYSLVKTMGLRKKSAKKTNEFLI